MIPPGKPIFDFNEYPWARVAPYLPVHTTPTVVFPMAGGHRGINMFALPVLINGVFLPRHTTPTNNRNTSVIQDQYTSRKG